MSGDYTKVQFAAMEQAQSDLVNSYSQLINTVDTLHTQLQTHLSTWNSSAQQSYVTVKQAWDSAMLDMSNALQSLAPFVGQANDNYLNAEAANVRMWGTGS